ncbi:MAG: hypothetical protein ACPHUF_00700 [Gammaproteobacteria bacterium]
MIRSDSLREFYEGVRRLEEMHGASAAEQTGAIETILPLRDVTETPLELVSQI